MKSVLGEMIDGLSVGVYRLEVMADSAVMLKEEGMSYVHHGDRTFAVYPVVKQSYPDQ